MTVLMRFDESLFPKIRFPSAEFLLEEERNGKDFMVLPWAPDNLNAFRQPGTRLAHANDGRGPPEQIEKGRVGVIKES